MDPIRYDVDVQQPFQSALAGYQLGAAVRNDQQAQQAQLEAQQAQQQLQMDLGRVLRNPSASPADFAALTLKYPQLKDQFKQANDMLSTEQKDNFMAHGTQVYAAMANGRSDIAKRLLDARTEAMTNSGDMQGAKAAQMMSSMVDESPSLAKNMMLLKLSGLDDKFAEKVGKLGTESRASDLHPDLVRKGAAEADKEGALAVSAAVDAKYAEQKAKGEIAQQGATLGLTRAQVAQAQALTSKYGAETRETLMKLQQIGRPTQQQQFDAEAKLRGEYNKATEGYTDVTEAYRRLKASNNDAAGDLSLIFSYMKMLDPGSVVREGEFATAQNAAGVPDRVRNLFNRLLDGQRLTDGQRKQFAGQAESLYGAAQKREGEARAGLTKVARNYGLNAENIFGGRASEGGGKGTPNSQRPPLSNFEVGG